MTFARLNVSGWKVRKLKVEGLAASQPSTFNLQRFTLVLLVAVALRCALWFAYQPVSYSDTPSYQRTALAVKDHWSVDGTRTPGYPVFLLLFRPEADGWQQRAWLGQMALGVIVTGLMYLLGWLTTGKNWAGVVMGLAYTLNLQQVFFECNLITEALTTFWLTLTLVGVALWLYQPARRSIGLAFAIGLAAALTAIVRPLFIFLPPWIALFLWLKVGKLKVEGWKINLQPSTFNLVHVAVFLLPSLLIIGGWVWFIHETYGNWSLTTMGGYHMIQHTGAYFEYVPDEYAAIRDTYIKYRDAQIAATGTQTNAIWEAIPEMTEVSGIGFYDLSDKLTEISMQLIREYPDLFLKNALEGWWMFWRAPVYWSADALRWPWLAAPLRVLILAERGALFAANMAFIGLSAGILALWIVNRLRKVEGCKLKIGSRTFNLQPSTFSLFIASAIWVCSIFQTLLDHGDNPRFLVPLQMGVILWLVVQVCTLNVRTFKR
jgi:hypothetical protein